MNTTKEIQKADKVARNLKSGLGRGNKGGWKQIASKAERRLGKALSKDNDDES